MNELIESSSGCLIRVQEHVLIVENPACHLSQLAVEMTTRAPVEHILACVPRMYNVAYKRRVFLRSAPSYISGRGQLQPNQLD